MTGKMDKNNFTHRIFTHASPLSQIEAAKPKENHTALLDGNGLYLVCPCIRGKRYGSFAYKIDGKEKILTVGKYPLMTLQEARDKAWTRGKTSRLASIR